MKFKLMEGENVLTLGKFKIELDNRGLLLLQGENLDNSSAVSNGAGKSSVVDALCWALYGTTARDVTGDAIINRKAKKDAFCKVLVEDSGIEYTITRHRKHHAFKNALIVKSRNMATGEETDLTKGTDKETQETIVKVIGCSLDVFMASVYAGQEKMPDLPGMTDKQLKLLIEEASGIEVLAKAYEEARQRHTAAKLKLSESGARLAAVESSAASAELEQAALVADEKDFEEKRKTRAAAHLVNIKPLQAKIEEVKKTIDDLDAESMTKELEECKKALASRREQEEKLAALDKLMMAARRTYDNLRHGAAVAKGSMEKAEASIADIKGQVGKPCGECGKTYCEHDLETAVEARRRALEEKKEEVRHMIPAIREAAAEVEKTQKERDDYKVSMTDVSAVSERASVLKDLLVSVERLKGEIKSHEAAIEMHRANAKNELTIPNPFTRLIAEKKTALAAAKEKIAEQKTAIEKLESEAELLGNAVKVFGPAGVRAHILDTVTPFLNERTREYLGALSDGNLHATWSTLSKTAKGELREKFNIEVTDDTGADSFEGLSGGEKRKVRLACAMALQDMVASRATKPLEMFIADEIDHALDEAGLERLMGVLDRKARERGTVIVISHQSLSDWIPNFITVTKKGGFSTLLGATEHTF